MKTKYLKITTAILAALSVSACGGGGGPVAKVPPIVVPVAPDVPHSFAEREDYIAGIKATIDAGDLAHLSVDFMPPTEGTANYAGVMVLPHIYSDGSLMGNSHTTIDFATNLSTGEAGGFTDENGQGWVGLLTIEGDFRSASTISGTLHRGVVDYEIDGKIELVDMDSYAPLASVENGIAIPEILYGHITGTGTAQFADIILNEDNAYYYGELVD